MVSQREGFHQRQLLIFGPRSSCYPSCCQIIIRFMKQKNQTPTKSPPPMKQPQCQQMIISKALTRQRASWRLEIVLQLLQKLMIRLSDWNHWWEKKSRNKSTRVFVYIHRIQVDAACTFVVRIGELCRGKIALSCCQTEKHQLYCTKTRVGQWTQSLKSRTIAKNNVGIVFSVPGPVPGVARPRCGESPSVPVTEMINLISVDFSQSWQLESLREALRSFLLHSWVKEGSLGCELLSY